MINLDFLSNLDVTPADELVKTKKPVFTKTPIEGDFRIFRKGAIAFTEAFKAQVGDKWIDVVFSTDWLQYPTGQPAIAFININSEEKPAKADIKKDGTVTYIKERFLALSTELWGIDWKNLAYVDFKLESPEVKVPIALLPKVVQRGEDKGKADYVKRENAVLIPFMPVISEIEADDAKAEDEYTPEDNVQQETTEVPDFSIGDQA